MPTIAGGTAKNVNGRPERASSPRKCSMIGIWALSNAVWIGRSPVRVSSMFTESMPTRRGAPFDEQLGGCLSEERVARVAVELGPPVLRPAGVHEDGAARDVLAVEERCVDFLDAAGLDEDARDGGNAGEVEAGEVVAVGEAVERSVEVGAGVGDHVDAPDLELEALGVSLP